VQNGDTTSLDEIRRSFASVLARGRAKRAIVFGSYARGEEDRYSDLDLIIVVETERSFPERAKEFLGLYDVWEKGIDILVYTPDELREMLDKRRYFIEKALEEGVVIYEE
jgi:predicted nucleotidyltransferase